MKHLLKYLNGYKKECILAPLFKMLEASFELIVPLVIAAIIDKGIAGGDKSYIVKSCALLALLALIGLISSFTAQFFAAKAATGFSTGVRRDLFAHLLGLSYKEFDKLGTATMITRMNSDVMAAQTGVNMFLRLFLRSPFVVFGAMIMAFTIDVKAALIFLAVITVLFIVVAVIMKSNIPLLVNVQQKLDRVLLITRENLTGARVLRAFTREEYEKADFCDASEDLYKGQMTAAGISSLMNPLTYVIINLAIVCLIYVSAIRVNAGDLSTGSVVALYNYMSQILVELIKLANLIVTLNKALAGGNRISDVLAMHNSQEMTLSEVITKGGDNAYIRFSHVNLKYNENADEALTDIDFSIGKGEVIGIIGGTGSGKSSLVGLIPRFYDVTSGAVCIEGTNVNDIPIDELRSRVGYVFQKASLFAGSISDNLKYGKKDASESEMYEAIHSAVADDVLEAKGGLDAEVGHNGMKLSGGQRQRISIARALVRKPEILILDDATSALDYSTQAKLLANIGKLAYKPTIFIVSQRTSAMIDADKIIVLEDGNVVGIGTHEELLAGCETYKDIHNTQFGEGGANNE